MKSLIKCKNCELYIPRNDDIGYCELRRTTVEKNMLCSLGTSDVVTDGYKHDGGKPRLSLVPLILIRAVGTVMTHGAEKYGEGNCPDYAEFRRAKDEYNQKVFKAKQEQNLKFSRMAKKHARLDKKYW